MSKRMIIVENCEDCPNSCMRFLIPEDRICSKMFTKQGERVCPDEGTPDWCPLPAVPRKNRSPASWVIRQSQITDEPVEYWSGYGQGWDACINTILGEEES